MALSCLTRSRLAWTGIALVLAGFGIRAISVPLNLPIWVVPTGYFTALAGAAVLFVGGVRWRTR
ncbi:hypothetical protein LX81_04089 [Palleronia aestuarii]|uniref:Uncharacterized protein n=1 Tax=Palleronia aestuarii TaxID=568105 RepID=A0A2W7NI03_9RHOB|nr:hypothetical protein [Palleronia aestuarii]PZX10902.1 hypothetical protein LX81_04089 [Palleronia aestuarii]